MSSNRSQRSSKPVNPENSALADELRSQLRGKPTRSGFNRSAGREIRGFIWDILRGDYCFVLCFCFCSEASDPACCWAMLQPQSLCQWDLTTAEESQTSFVYDSEGNVIAKLTGSENVDRIYVPISQVKNTYMDEAMISIEGRAFLRALGHRSQAYRQRSAVCSGSRRHCDIRRIHYYQQTVKLISGQDEHSTSRKVQEWFSAMQRTESVQRRDTRALYEPCAYG